MPMEGAPQRAAALRSCTACTARHAPDAGESTAPAASASLRPRLALAGLLASMLHSCEDVAVKESETLSRRHVSRRQAGRPAVTAASEDGGRSTGSSKFRGRGFIVPLLMMASGVVASQWFQEALSPLHLLRLIAK